MPVQRLSHDVRVAVAAAQRAGMLGPGPFAEHVRPVPRRMALPCVHIDLDRPLGEPVCSGHRAYPCAVHGRCTILPCRDAPASCEGGKGRPPCPEYDARPASTGRDEVATM